MSKAEILDELPKLGPQDRAEIQARLDELAGPGWLDDGELTDEEKRLLDARLDECERNPSSFVPWEEAKARIMASLKQ
jgi:putative addiction module component (TIGR02574 family)